MWTSEKTATAAAAMGKAPYLATAHGVDDRSREELADGVGRRTRRQHDACWMDGRESA
jgi:hypothetical protein